MKVTFYALVSFLLAVQAAPQSAATRQEMLHSADWELRKQAYEQIAGANGARTAEITNNEEIGALVDLLSRENRTLRAAFSAGGASATFGESYSEYTAWLADSVLMLAEKHPDLPGIWDALVLSGFNPESSFTRRLAAHGDRVLHLLKLFLAAQDPLLTRGDVIVILAQIVAFERAGTSGHLSQVELSGIENLIRSSLADKDPVIRYDAVSAVALMGSEEDLALLDKLSREDSQFVTNGGQNGTELRYPMREHASRAADKLRGRLRLRRQ